MSAIFYHDETQQKLALETKAALEKERNRAVATKVLPAEQFYDAEEYHQKYILKHHPALMNHLDIDPDDITDSHVCTRLNGYVAGYGNLQEFEKEWPLLGLTAKLAEYVIKEARKGVRGSCGQ